MYIGAQAAMQRREYLESPSCAVRTMQQPDLGRLGRLVGPPIVTLGDVTPTQILSNVTDVTGASSLVSSPLLIGGIALLFIALIAYTAKGTGRQIRSARLKRAKRRARISALQSELELARAGG